MIIYKLYINRPLLHLGGSSFAGVVVAGGKHGVPVFAYFFFVFPPASGFFAGLAIGEGGTFGS